MSEPTIKVLLIEDDEEDFLITRDLLDEVSDARYDIVWGKTYEEGLASLSGQAFDVCLTDYRIGKRTGLEFISECSPQHRSTPFILLTGIYDHTVDIAAEKAGAADYLEKGELTPRLLERSIRFSIRRNTDILALEEAQASLIEAKDQLETKISERTRELSSANRALQSEIAERARAEEQLRHDAFHDRLTNLPNGELFTDRVSHSIGRATRANTKSFAVLVVNLDRFRVVNDDLGHRAGDELLKTIATRLRRAVRSGDTVARIGGDAFGILIENVEAEKSAVSFVERLRELLKDPILIDAQEIFCTFAVGIALSDLGYCSAERMLQDAFTALNNARRRGTNCYEVFELSMRSSTTGILKVEADLRRALRQDDEFELFYQPVVKLASGKIAGFEALIRWRHPRRGIVPPNEFIPIAEETGLIVPIGRWVMREAASQLAAWQAEFPTYRPMFMSFNVSCRQFVNYQLVDDVRSTIETTGIDPSDLKIELTESFLMEDPERAKVILQRLKALHVELSIDDFGTGYSSLSYLRRFPFDVLKIDRCFVRAMTVADEDLEIIQTIVNLAGVLGMNVVAEGAETAEEVECLKDLGCHYVQGFYYAPPLPAQEIRGKLVEQSRPALPKPMLENKLAALG